MFSTTKSTVSLTSTVSGTNVTLRWAAGGGCPASNFTVRWHRAGSEPSSSIGPASVSDRRTPGHLLRARGRAECIRISGPSNEVVVQIAGTGPSVAQLRGSVFSAPYGDPDKALYLQFLPTLLAVRS